MRDYLLAHSLASHFATFFFTRTRLAILLNTFFLLTWLNKKYYIVLTAVYKFTGDSEALTFAVEIKGPD